MTQLSGSANEAFVTSDGIRIAYSRRSSAHAGAPRVVLVHSLGMDRHVWDGVVERLSPSCDLLTYDCRGHGASGKRAGVFTAELFARDLAELLDHVGWASATVAGCSMGGCVALAFAGAYPARVERLGLVDTTAWYGDGAAARFAERANEARTKGLGGLIDFQLTRWFTDAYRERRPPELESALASFLANDVECYIATTALLGSVDLRGVLATIAVPTAIVVGAEDYATPVAMSEALHAGIAGSTLTVLPHGRHLTSIECADDVAAVIRQWLARR